MRVWGERSERWGGGPPKRALGRGGGASEQSELTAGGLASSRRM